MEHELNLDEIRKRNERENEAFWKIQNVFRENPTYENFINYWIMLGNKLYNYFPEIIENTKKGLTADIAFRFYDENNYELWRTYRETFELYKEKMSNFGDDYDGFTVFGMF